MKKGKDVDAFLTSWRQRIRHELKSNSLNRLGSRRPAVASSIPDNFPDDRVLNLYINPLTSWSGDQILSSTKWIQKEPDVERIANICSHHLGWKNENTLKKAFHKGLWESVVCQMLYSVSS